MKSNYDNPLLSTDAAESERLDKLFLDVVNMSPREKIKKLYRVLSWRVNSPILDINMGRERYNSSLLLACLTCLIKGKMLLFGPSGTGKSTIVESVAQLLFGDPIDSLQAAAIHGHSQVTMEDLARAVLPAEHPVKDTENVHSRDISQVSILFIDDLSGMGEAAQTLLNTLLEEGVVIRQNVRYSIVERPVFATSNRLVAGDHRTRALLDRFHIAALPTGMNPEWLATLIKGLKVTRLPSRGFNIHDADLQTVANEIAAVDIAPGIQDMLQFFLAELTHCERLSRDMHFTGKACAYLENEEALYSLCGDCEQRKNNPVIICQYIANSVSTRALEGLVLYIRAFAWFMGLKIVDNPAVVEAVLPYVFIHRVVPAPAAKAQNPDTLPRIPWLRELWKLSSVTYEQNLEAIDTFRTAMAMIMNEDGLREDVQTQVRETASMLKTMNTPARFAYLTALESRAVDAGMADLM